MLETQKILCFPYNMVLVTNYLALHFTFFIKGHYYILVQIQIWISKMLHTPIPYKQIVLATDHNENFMRPSLPSIINFIANRVYPCAFAFFLCSYICKYM